VAEAASEIANRAKTELGAKGLQMQITGKVSERARKELQSIGWTLTEGASAGSPTGR
jgi:hypothetical protein